MIVKPCNTYAARPAGQRFWQHGPSAFKIYYVDIYGREHPERFEWAPCGLDQAVVPAALATLGVEGVGFVIAFPHIVKVFRWSPQAEILLLVKAFKPADLSPILLDRDEGYVEFACLAEALIAADEYRLWAAATSVAGYLAQWSSWADTPIVDHAKLRRYWPAA